MPENLALQWAQTNCALAECKKINNSFFYINSLIQPVKEKTPLKDQALLKIVETNAIRSLLSYARESVPNGYKNQAAVKVVYSNGNHPIKGIEFSTANSGDWYAAVAVAPYNETVEYISQVLESREFFEAYCVYLLPKAKKLFDQENYKQALVILKEMHDLKWARADAYILAAESFIKNGETDEAKKIALEILADLEPQLTANLAENLGDVFIELKCDKQAEEAYNIAIAILESDGYI